MSLGRVSLAAGNLANPGSQHREQKLHPLAGNSVTNFHFLLATLSLLSPKESTIIPGQRPSWKQKHEEP